ncbi:MAG: hypothetical protein Q8Q42_00820 [Nanoarchaeota archaeon]|nr:hypothetical protein [Nanoarchaeota archaeon]
MKRVLKLQDFVFINVHRNRKYTKINSKKVLPFEVERNLCKIT